MKFTLQPILGPLRRRVGLGTIPELTEVARRRVQLAPAEVAVRPRAVFLDGQLERIEAWVFLDHHPGPDLLGGREVTHGATIGYELEDVVLLDGVLYCRGATIHLQPRTHRIPDLRVTEENPVGALYSTTVGNTYFGNWILDDLPKYLLAEAHGPPVTSQAERGGHYAAYEGALGLRPLRARATHFRTLHYFDDVGQNRDKRRRFELLSARLGGPEPAAPHPGVFIIRGLVGQRRLLQNEEALAERLAERRGFRILDPMKSSLAEIVAACRGAQVVIGVEGSALAHGALFLTPGTCVFTLQPPRRFCTVFKDVADRQEVKFAFVVGTPIGEDFSVAPDEVERTLDLLP